MAGLGLQEDTWNAETTVGDAYGPYAGLWRSLLYVNVDTNELPLLFLLLVMSFLS